MISTRPNANRRNVSQATLVKKRGMVSAHLSKDLRKQYKRRSLSLRKGDQVKVVRGQHSGKTGSIEEIHSNDMTVFISGIKLKRTIGTEKNIKIKPSNIIITNLDLGDKKRQKVLLRKVKEIKFEETTAAPKAAPKAGATKKVEEKKPAAPVKKEVKKNEPKKTEGTKVLESSKKGN